MTYHPNDPTRRPPGDPVHHPANIDPVAYPVRRDYGASAWIVGVVALIAAFGIIFWAMSDRTNVASTDRPAMTETQQGPPGPPQTAPTTTTRGQDTNTGATPAPAPAPQQ